MAYDKGMITAPVSINDVLRCVPVTLKRTNSSTGQVERRSSCDLGVLCGASVGDTITSSDGKGNWTVESRVEINMWAKYKPVIYAAINTTSQLNSAKTAWKTESELGTGNKAWWRGTNGQCGLSFPMIDIGASANNSSGVITALNSLKTMIDGKLNGWAYIKPSGGMASPYRLIDFLRHYKDAPNPVSGVSVTPQIQASSSSDWELGCTLREPVHDNIDNRDYIVPQDIATAVLGSNRTLTLGIAIFKEDKTPMAWVTDNVWEGRGVMTSDWSGSEVSTAQSGGDIVTTVRFKDQGTYLVLPVYFILINITDLNQPQLNMSKNPSNALCKLVPVPFTNFYGVTCSLASTSQRYGYPNTSNRNITVLGKFTADIYLDRSSSYYNATGTIQVAWGLFNESWNGSDDPSSWASGTYMDYTTKSITITSTSGTTVPVQDGYNVTGVPTLDHTWSLVIWVAGEKRRIALRQTSPVTT